MVRSAMKQLEKWKAKKRMKTLFTGSFCVERIVTGLELYAGQKIEPDNTLLSFDKVQEAIQALSALKYFNEKAPQYQIVCASSLLGVALHPGISFPVGKVEFLDLYPLSFLSSWLPWARNSMWSCWKTVISRWRPPLSCKSWGQWVKDASFALNTLKRMPPELKCIMV